MVVGPGIESRDTLVAVFAPMAAYTCEHVGRDLVTRLPMQENWIEACGIHSDMVVAAYELPP